MRAMDTRTGTHLNRSDAPGRVVARDAAAVLLLLAAGASLPTLHAQAVNADNRPDAWYTDERASCGKVLFETGRAVCPPKQNADLLAFVLQQNQFPQGRAEVPAGADKLDRVTCLARPPTARR